MSALRNLLPKIIDYAGLFPPAAFPLPDVVRNYAAYVPGDHSWMLARLIVPASRLAELADVYRTAFPQGIDQPAWQISALIPPVDNSPDAFESTMRGIDKFNQENDFAVVDTVEGKLPAADLIEPTCARLLDSLAAFLEIPHTDPDETISKLAAIDRPNTFAKIRTGGVTPDLIPTPERVANFIRRCADARLGFKATAGLHHPLRAIFALTYESESPRATMHGFINVFLAACYARQKNWSTGQLTALLDQRDPAAFSMAEDQIEFDGQALTADEIATVRRDFAISFGSCSFVEPIDDLIRLGWLADAAKTV